MDTVIKNIKQYSYELDSNTLKELIYITSKYRSVKNYMKSLGINKPIHIGETGWASISKDLY